MINIKLTKTREELVKMYIESLNEGNIPWRTRWINSSNINGVSKMEYRGVNQLILNFTTFKEKYNDNRWYTYKQIENMGLKLKDAKGKGVPVEFWSSYNIKLKRKFNFREYLDFIEKYPERKDEFRIIAKGAIVFNGSLVDGLEPAKTLNSNIETSKYISKIINKLKIGYEEHGNEAFYNPILDNVVLPEKQKFIDKYSYYATQLHELSHSTGHPNRLNRNLISKDKRDYAREELVAEISSSFLMQNLNIPATAEHIDNHKAYIQSWIEILKDKPNELFKAINEANKVCEYLDNLCKVKTKNKEVR